MVLKKIHILLFLVICVVASSCHHAHVTVSADVKDLGEHIRTKYRYKAIRQEDQLVEYQFAHLQPDVFDNTDGVPITLNVHKPHRKDVTGPPPPFPFTPKAQYSRLSCHRAAPPSRRRADACTCPILRMLPHAPTTIIPCHSNH